MLSKSSNAESSAVDLMPEWGSTQGQPLVNPGSTPACRQPRRLCRRDDVEWAYESRTTYVVCMFPPSIHRSKQQRAADDDDGKSRWHVATPDSLPLSSCRNWWLRITSQSLLINNVPSASMIRLRAFMQAASFRVPGATLHSSRPLNSRTQNGIFCSPSVSRSQPAAARAMSACTLRFSCRNPTTSSSMMPAGISAFCSRPSCASLPAVFVSSNKFIVIKDRCRRNLGSTSTHATGSDGLSGEHKRYNQLRRPASGLACIAIP